jgi:hypothetical protein
MDQMFRARGNGMTGALMAGDKATAMSQSTRMLRCYNVCLIN